MRVLDVGCGGGDVAFLAADLVGPTGQVVGVDRSAIALATARTRAEVRSLAHVTFHECELSAMAFDQPFDAAIGRYVLCFQPDPAALLRSIANLVRPGGSILFHEPDREQMRSFPPASTYDRACQWVGETYRRAGVDVRMGIKLYSTFLAAGLLAPTMRLHAVIGGANALDVVHLDADQAVVLAADMERWAWRRPASSASKRSLSVSRRRWLQTGASSSVALRSVPGRPFRGRTMRRRDGSRSCGKCFCSYPDHVISECLSAIRQQ